MLFRSGAAKGNVTLIVIGLLISIPLIVWGSTLVLRLIDRYPLIILLGGALLGYIAGDIGYTDPAIAEYVVDLEPYWHWVSKFGCAALALGIGLTIRNRVREVP